jgi:hypothetical protein
MQNLNCFFEVGLLNKFQNTNFRIYSYFYVVSHVFFAFGKYVFVLIGQCNEITFEVYRP